MADIEGARRGIDWLGRVDLPPHRFHSVCADARRLIA